MSAVLITGADGHLGRAIARRLLARTADALILWVRARTPQELLAKETRLADLLADPRCRIACGELSEAEPFAAVDPRAVAAIVHTAAITAFTVSDEAARRVNVEGARKLLAFARRCPSLRACLLTSTLHAAGLRDGDIAENAFARPPSFANPYEASKWAMERTAIEDFPDVPWCVARIGTIAAADASGEVAQHNAIHNTLRLFLNGLLPVLAGRPEARVYMTTTAFCAAACVALLGRAEAHAFFHVSDAWEEALALGETIDIVRTSFAADGAFRARHVPAPLFCDLETFRTLVRGADAFSPVMGQALSSIAPFAPQLFCDKRVANARLRAALPGLDPPRMRDILPRICAHIAAHRGATA